jgi:uncharacterized protein YecA (UPF0149 family)
MPSPRAVFPLRLPPAIRARVEALAAQEGTSLNSMVCRMLAHQLGLPKSVLLARATAEREPVLEARASARRIDSTGGQVGRNAPCPCESGKKFKRCCGQTERV